MLATNMKILICHRPGGAFGYISDSWINCLHDRGHVVQRWDGQLSSWQDFDPDVYIGCSGHKQPIPKPRRAKIAIHVNPWGPVKIDGINESEANIQWTLDKKPDAVFGYGFESDRLLWSYWTEKAGIPWVPMPTAADKVIYQYRVDRTQRPLDIVYLGGRWTYKALTIDKFLFPVLKACSYQLHGWGDWPNNVCSGVLPEDQVTNFFNTGKIGPCISEQHTQRYGIDIPERAFKVSLCGCLIVHDPVPRLDAIIPGVVVARDQNDYLEKCLYYIRNEAERIQLAEQQRQQVLNNHTYHHRMRGLLSVLGFAEQAQDMLDD